MVKVEVFLSSGCNQCKQAIDVLEHLANEFSNTELQWRNVNVVEEIDYAVSLGVLSTPAIAINEKLIFTRLPSAENLKKRILSSLKQ